MLPQFGPSQFIQRITYGVTGTEYLLSNFNYVYDGRISIEMVRRRIGVRTPCVRTVDAYAYCQPRPPAAPHGVFACRHLASGPI